MQGAAFLLSYLCDLAGDVCAAVGRVVAFQWSCLCVSADDVRAAGRGAAFQWLFLLTGLTAAAVRRGRWMLRKGMSMAGMVNSGQRRAMQRERYAEGRLPQKSGVDKARNYAIIKVYGAESAQGYKTAEETEMIRIAIVEDEASASSQLVQYIERYCEKSGILHEVKIFDNPVSFLDAYKVDFDVIFLDIMMPDMDGIRAAHKVRERDGEVPIIFVTNMRQFAIKGYEVGALDFIVKPVSYYGFEIAFRKALRAIAQRQEAQVTVFVRGGAKRVAVSDLRYVEVSLHRLIYHLIEESVETGGNLKDVEQALYPLGFRRCNHCYIVNMRYVTEIRENSVILGPGAEELQVSRSKKKAFLGELSKYWGG